MLFGSEPFMIYGTGFNPYPLPDWGNERRYHTRYNKGKRSASRRTRSNRRKAKKRAKR